MYSTLNLTYATDRAYAVAGLQYRIADAFRSAVTCGVLWRWPERMLLWCAVQPCTLTKIQYPAKTAAPPSWSWMAYDGHITFLDIPFDSVDWTGEVQEPKDMVLHRLHVNARKMRIDNADLMGRAVLDAKDVNPAQSKFWQCVLLGKRRECQNDDDAEHYVLLIRSFASLSDQPGHVYERVGVATLLGRHISIEESPVIIA